jgi:hypothetical protein
MFIGFYMYVVPLASISLEELTESLVTVTLVESAL